MINATEGITELSRCQAFKVLMLVIKPGKSVSADAGCRQPQKAQSAPKGFSRR